MCFVNSSQGSSANWRTALRLQERPTHAFTMIYSPSTLCRLRVHYCARFAVGDGLLPALEGRSSRFAKFPQRPVPEHRTAVQPEFWRSVVISWRFLMKNDRNTVPRKAIPVQKLNKDMLLSAPDNSL